MIFIYAVQYLQQSDIVLPYWNTIEKCKTLTDAMYRYTNLKEKYPKENFAIVNLKTKKVIIQTLQEII